MKQIRIHGRGGQGVVAASELLAIAFFKDGKKSQAFPNFGVERSGAPIQSFVRVSDKDILSRDHVYNPDILIIQDDSLIGKSNVFSGIKKSTLIIINSKEKLNNLFVKIKKEKDLPKNFSEKNVLVVDDVIRSGKTLWLVKNHLQKCCRPKSISFFVLFKVKSLQNEDYRIQSFSREIDEDVVFPWD